MNIQKRNTVTGLISTITEAEFKRLKTPYLNAMEVLKKTGYVLIGDVVYRLAEERN